MEDWKSWDDVPDIEPGDFEYYEALLNELGIKLVEWQHNKDFCSICKGYAASADWWAGRGQL